jgi:hypothetical protein
VFNNVIYVVGGYVNDAGSGDRGMETGVLILVIKPTKISKAKQVFK